MRRRTGRMRRRRPYPTRASFAAKLCLVKAAAKGTNGLPSRSGVGPNKKRRLDGGSGCAARAELPRSAALSGRGGAGNMIQGASSLAPLCCTACWMRTQRAEQTDVSKLDVELNFSLLPKVPSSTLANRSHELALALHSLGHGPMRRHHSTVSNKAVLHENEAENAHE